MLFISSSHRYLAFLKGVLQVLPQLLGNLNLRLNTDCVSRLDAIATRVEAINPFRHIDILENTLRDIVSEEFPSFFGATVTRSY